MLKNLFKFIILIVVLYGVGRLYVVVSESQLTGVRAPYIQDLTRNSVHIRWLTDENTMGVVRYGEYGEHPESIEIEDSPRKNHSLTLAGLKPATFYYYKVGDIEGYVYDDPEKFWFETPPTETVPTRIWVIGDSGEPGKVQDDVRDSALDWIKQNPLTENNDGSEDSRGRINVWLDLGDIAYRSGTNDQYQKALFEPYGDLLANTPFWPVYGNHDQRRLTYFRIFDLPEKGEAGGVASETENYYSFNYSNVHFVMLDSETSDRSTAGSMYRWLKEDLEVNNLPWVIAAFHHPPYTHGSHDSDSEYDSRGRMEDMRKNFVPLLESAGVDLVLSGHSHMYERSYMIDCYYGDSKQFDEHYIVSKGTEGKNKNYIKTLDKKAHQGATFIVAGSSSKVDKGPLDHPVHVVSWQEAGSVVIDVVQDKMNVRFINDKGEVKDAFSITKEKGLAPTQAKCGDTSGDKPGEKPADKPADRPADESN